MEQKILDLGRRLVLGMILMLLLAGTAMGEVTRDGLVAEWHFDGDAKDSSGNGNDGVIHGATFVDGVNGKALSFDGVNDYVDVTEVLNGPNWNEVTIEAMVKTNSNTNDFQAIVSSTNSGDFVHLQLYSAGNIAIYTDTGGASLPVISQTPTGEWRHIAISSKSGNTKLFENGVDIANNFATFSYIRPATELHIGNGYNNGRFFKGSIEEVRIYNRALSINEIQANYDALISPPDTTLPSLLVSSPFDGEAFNIDTIMISGTATDDSSLSKIEVNVGSGSWQLASGTTSWSKSVILNSGSNTIHARATDTSGNTKETSVTISYTPPAVPPTPDPATTAPATPTPTTQPTSTPKDSDGDGWSDEQEHTAGTNPNKADTDGDGIWDSKDSNPLVVEKSPEPINIQIQESEQKQAVEEPNINVNVENTNTNTNINEDSGIESLYIGIGAIGILLIGIIAVSSSRKGKISSATNINIGKVGDSANRVVNDHSTTTNVDNRDGVMQRSNIGGDSGIDEKLASLKNKYDKGLITEKIYEEMQKDLLGKM